MSTRPVFGSALGWLGCARATQGCCLAQFKSVCPSTPMAIEDDENFKKREQALSEICQITRHGIVDGVDSSARMANGNN